jgi:hypothetical protein
MRALADEGVILLDISDRREEWELFALRRWISRAMERLRIGSGEALAERLERVLARFLHPSFAALLTPIIGAAPVVLQLSASISLAERFVLFGHAQNGVDMEGIEAIVAVLEELGECRRSDDCDLLGLGCAVLLCIAVVPRQCGQRIPHHRPLRTSSEC